MMPKKEYGFDQIINRRNTNCGRWDTMDKKYESTDLIHLGVADMDFQAPEPIRNELQRCVEHGVFGYTDLSDKFYSAIQGWMKRKHQVNVKKEEIVFCPRINISSGLCVEIYTEPEDEVIINTPAYGPLYQAIVKHNRVVIESPLHLQDNRYTIDLEQLESRITSHTKMFILCSPHNPVGRVWSEEELLLVGAFCLKHNLTLFVDEIHGDIVANGMIFKSALTLPEPIRNITIVATSLTKTFNIPGVIVSYMMIPNEELRNRAKQEIDRIGMHNPTIFSVIAVEEGYTNCDEWYEAMCTYINQNEIYTRDYFKVHLPGFHIYPREGTYLLWMDYKALGCTEKELEYWFIKEAKVSVYMGTVFQEEGRGFIRVNIASPRVLLEEAFAKMTKAYKW